MTALDERVVWTVPGAASDPPGIVSPIFLRVECVLGIRFREWRINLRRGTRE